MDLGDLGDLGDAHLRQLKEDLYQEVALRELNVPLRDPPLGHWGTPAGNGIPMCMAMGHFPEREGMGTTRTTTSTHCPSQPDEDIGCLINTLATGL